mgnify:CR=1 FL=1
MKKYKVIASYVTQCEVEIEAEDMDQAYLIAKELDGGSFKTTIDGDDWQIEQVTELKGSK